MSLDYSPEVLRQHSDWIERRRRLFGRPQVQEIPVAKLITVIIPKKTPEPVENIERDWLIVAEPYAVNDICKEVCKQFKIRKNEFLSHHRHASLVEARQVAMTLAKYLTTRSYPEIGRLIGGRDHTTVIHAYRKYEGVMHATAAKVTAGSPIQVWVQAFKAQMAITPVVRKQRGSIEPIS